jgi:PKD repeat protein
MKKLMYFFSIAIIFSACQKYEFPEEDDSKVLDTEIQVKNSQGEFVTIDTATITADIQVILKAVTLYGDPDQWYWNFGDGNSAQGQQVDHLYDEPGVYNVAVTAIDGGNSDESEIVIVAESSSQAVFSLHSSDPPNNEGQIRYVVSGSKEYISNPPVPENGPFGYQGSNPESDWDVIQITPDTSTTRIYWEIITNNAVYSQAFGGFDENNNFIWAEMDESRFFSSSYNHLRVGFLDGEIVEEENFVSPVLGSSGDDGANPEFRFEVDEQQNQLHIFINIFDYADDIDSPKARFKVKKEDAWSEQHETQWVGGTGYVKYSAAINSAGEYRLRVEPNKDNPGTYTIMNNSDFYNNGENCIIVQLIQVNGVLKLIAI